MRRAPDDRLTEQKLAVEAVLHEIGADDIPIELVLNKIDAVDPLRQRRLENAYPAAVQVSARTGAGLDVLKHRIAERFADRFEPVQLLVPYDAGDVLSELYAIGTPIEERRDTEEGVLVRARLTGPALRRYAPYLVAGAERAGTTRTAS